MITRILVFAAALGAAAPALAQVAVGAPAAPPAVMIKAKASETPAPAAQLGAAMAAAHNDTAIAGGTGTDASAAPKPAARQDAATPQSSPPAHAPATGGK